MHENSGFSESSSSFVSPMSTFKFVNVLLIIFFSSRFSIFCTNARGLYCAPTFQADSRWNGCQFHPFHMESVWLRAQPFRRKFPCLFHMEIQWNLNIPWNIALESRWNPPQFNPWIPHYATWIPYYSTLFHMDSTRSFLDALTPTGRNTSRF